MLHGNGSVRTVPPASVQRGKDAPTSRSPSAYTGRCLILPALAEPGGATPKDVDGEHVDVPRTRCGDLRTRAVHAWICRAEDVSRSGGDLVQPKLIAHGGKYTIR